MLAHGGAVMTGHMPLALFQGAINHNSVGSQGQPRSSMSAIVGGVSVGMTSSFVWYRG